MATFDIDKALEQIGGDAESLSLLVGTFRRVSPEQIARIRFAIAESDAEMLKSTAHCFKASLGVFAAEPATGLVRRLEQCAHEVDFETAAETVEELERECSRLEADLTNYASSVE